MTRTFSKDRGVSPVIGAILMVAITVVLAATVYVWVGNLGSTPTAPQQASATARGFDTGADGRIDLVRVTLTQAERPYAGNYTSITLLDTNGTPHTTVCQTGVYDQTEGCNDPFDADELWHAGTSLYLPCRAQGHHSVTVAVRGTTILDTSVRCGQAAGS